MNSIINHDGGGSFKNFPQNDAHKFLPARPPPKLRTMKPESFLLPLIHAASVTANFLHWDHHDENIVKHFKSHGPFSNGGLVPEGYEATCEAEATFKAKQYKKSELHATPPYGLAPWAAGIEAFLAGREYPGHWKGDDDQPGEEGAGREYLMMDYSRVPRPVRQWIEDHQRKGVDAHSKWMFAVFEIPKGDENVTKTIEPRPTAVEGAGGNKTDGVEHVSVVPDEQKILFFAAGAIYEILPLWVAQGSQCECKPILVQLDNITRFCANFGLLILAGA